jgi:hypothetical protein
VGDTFDRQPNISFGQIAKLYCYCTTKYDTKVNIRVGEQLILNLILSHNRTQPEVALNKPKLLITRITNALNG